MPVPPSLSITAPEFALVCTATTRSIGKRHPIHLYRLRHIVVVENQVVGGEAVDEVAFGIGDGSGRDDKRDGAFELRASEGKRAHDRRTNALERALQLSGHGELASR